MYKTGLQYFALALIIFGVLALNLHLKDEIKKAEQELIEIEQELEELKKINEELNQEIDKLENQLHEVEEEVDNLFGFNAKVTAYAPYESKGLCSDGNPNVTATGTTPTEGRTIAVDPDVIPYGSQVHIEGEGVFIAEDAGSAIRGERIDIMFDSREDALNFGRQERKIIVREDN